MKELTVLPVEVKELASKVSIQKQSEVSTILTQIFTGTADWERQVDEIEVKGIDDKMSISLAETARKNAKSARLSAEKIFDAKREEVQRIKAEFDNEDKLWLKAKQIMQIKFKAIEEKAEWKANFIKRYESEQKELQTQNRILKVAALDANINRFEFENMSEQSFELFLKSLEQRIADQKAAAEKAEQERIEKERAEAAERERIRKENERLKAEAELAEAERKLIEQKAAAEKAKADEELRKHQEAARKAAAAAAAEKAALEAQLKAKADAEAKLKAAAAAAEKAKADEEARAAKAPKKKRLTEWVNSFNIVVPIGLETDDTVIDVVEKFERFKSWAITQVNAI